MSRRPGSPPRPGRRRRRTRRGSAALLGPVGAGQPPGQHRQHEHGVQRHGVEPLEEPGPVVARRPVACWISASPRAIIAARPRDPPAGARSRPAAPAACSASRRAAAEGGDGHRAEGDDEHGSAERQAVGDDGVEAADVVEVRRDVAPRLHRDAGHLDDAVDGEHPEQPRPGTAGRAAGRTLTQVIAARTVPKERPKVIGLRQDSGPSQGRGQIRAGTRCATPADDEQGGDRIAGALDRTDVLHGNRYSM